MNKKIKMSAAEDNNNNIPKKNLIKMIKKMGNKLIETTSSNHAAALKNDESSNCVKNIDLKSDNLIIKNNNKCVKSSEITDTKKNLEKSNSKCINKSVSKNNVKIASVSGKRKKNIVHTVCENVDNATISGKISSTSSKRQRVDSQKEGSPPPQPPSKIVKISEGVCNDIAKGVNQTEQRVVTKPPLPPPKADKSVLNQMATVKAPRMKRKLEENNAQLVQKLSAHAEQLRLEIGELKTALISEKNAVRVLRAQNEADSRRAKTETKKLQEALHGQELKVKKSNREHEVHLHTEQVGQPTSIVTPALSLDNTKLNQEITALRDANKFLEEKIQISSDAEKRKIADIHELKDAYEIRLTQISKSAKSQIQRLLEELKTKERLNGQLKRELELSKDVQKKDIRQAQHSQEMRKLKEIERSNCNTKLLNTDNNNNNNDNNINNNNCIINNDNLPTCEEDFIKMTHDNEMPERIAEAHTELHIFRNKDSIGSDSDSALSSAPPSLSPQPATCPNSPDVWRTFASKENEPYVASQKELDCLQMQNEALLHELSAAKNHIADLEKALIMMREGSNSSIQQYIEKIAYLEQREDLLIKEVHELREQNELNEFRIIELEESHDKWSLRSNLIPDTRDVWTDTERESEDILMLSDRSDSGITSPQSQHHFDDHHSACPLEDISIIEQMPSEDIRKRLSVMSKRNCYDDDDKLCLLQVLSLLNNLEALSQDHEITGEDLSIDFNMGRFKYSLSPDTSTPRSLPDSSTTSPLRARHQGRIVATVSPYSTVDNLGDNSLREDSASSKKSKFWSANNCSLQESGVFDGEQVDFVSQCTQTEPEDFVLPVEKANGDLCAEIQKLNEFREKIEECVTKSSSKSPGVVNFLATDSCEQRRLQYYKDRLELLENKLLVYESTGDLQVRRLTERLQREIRLESLVKQLTEKCDKLQKDNLRLEEERCEFEEAENDTRLRLQRLEVDLDILSQRNVELEMSRDVAQAKLQDSRTHANCLEDTLHKCKDRLYLLEEHETDLKRKLEMITTFMPAILLFNTWKTQEACKSSFKDSARYQSASIPNCPCVERRVATSSYESPLQDQLHDMMRREKELTQNITELNRAYNETLENADNLWAQMEKEYKDKLANSEENECNLRCKLAQLEERLVSDSQFAQERISQLEESENAFKLRICKLNKENKDLSVKHSELLDEFHTLRDEYQKLKNYLEGPAADCLEKERRKVKELDEELILGQKMLHDVEEVHKNEILMIKNQLCKANKELIHIEVTNGELKEEVNTLELRLAELLKQRETDDETIKNLSKELISKETQLDDIKPKVGSAVQSLAQELNTSSVKRVDLSGINDINTAAAKLAEALKNIEDCGNCFSHTPELKEVAKEVKELADSIVSRSVKKEKKSENEVSDSKPPKPPGPPGPPGSSGSSPSPPSSRPHVPPPSGSPKNKYDTEKSPGAGQNIQIKTEKGLADDIVALMPSDIIIMADTVVNETQDNVLISVSDSNSTKNLSKSSLTSSAIDGSKLKLLEENFIEDTELQKLDDENDYHKTDEKTIFNDNLDEQETVHEISSTYEVVVLPGAESGYEFLSEHELLSKLSEENLHEISTAQNDDVIESEHELLVITSKEIEESGISKTISPKELPINDETQKPISMDGIEDIEETDANKSNDIIEPLEEDYGIDLDNIREEIEESKKELTDNKEVKEVKLPINDETQKPISMDGIEDIEETDAKKSNDIIEPLKEDKGNDLDNIREEIEESEKELTDNKEVKEVKLPINDETQKPISMDGIENIKETDAKKSNEIIEPLEEDYGIDLDNIREKIEESEKELTDNKEVKEVKLPINDETQKPISMDGIKDIEETDAKKSNDIIEALVEDTGIDLDNIPEEIEKSEKEITDIKKVKEVKSIEINKEEDEASHIIKTEKEEEVGKGILKVIAGVEEGKEIKEMPSKEIEAVKQEEIMQVKDVEGEEGQENINIAEVVEAAVEKVEEIVTVVEEKIFGELEAVEEVGAELFHKIEEIQDVKDIDSTKEMEVMIKSSKPIIDEKKSLNQADLPQGLSATKEPQEIDLSKETLITKDHLGDRESDHDIKHKEGEILIGTSEIISPSKIIGDSLKAQGEQIVTDIRSELMSGEITDTPIDEKKVKVEESVSSKEKTNDKSTSTTGMSGVVEDIDGAGEVLKMKPDVDVSVDINKKSAEEIDTKSPLDLRSSVTDAKKAIERSVSSILDIKGLLDGIVTNITETSKKDALDLSVTSQEFTNVKSMTSIEPLKTSQTSLSKIGNVLENQKISTDVTLSDVLLKPADYENSPIMSSMSYVAITTDTDSKSDMIEQERGEKPLDLSVHASLASAAVENLTEKEMDREHENEKELADGEEVQQIGDTLSEKVHLADQPIDLSSTHGEFDLSDYPTLCLDKLISIIKEQIPPSPAASLAEKQIRQRFVSDKDFRKDIEAIMLLSKQYVMESLVRTNQDVLYCMTQANTEVDKAMQCIRAIQGYFSPLVSPQCSVECADQLNLSGTSMICDVLCWQKRSNTRQEQ